MDTLGLSAFVGLLIALSVASERLVEILKGLVPVLNEASDNSKKEGWRRATLQLLAVAAGIITAFLARPVIGEVVSETWNTVPGVLALGLLASGGSGFWNSVATYMTRLKDLKKLSVEQERRKLGEGTPVSGAK